MTLKLEKGILFFFFIPFVGKTHGHFSELLVRANSDREAEKVRTSKHPCHA